MKSTINTEAGRITMEATPAGVIVNGKRMPATEAALFAHELLRCVQASAVRSSAYIASVGLGLHHHEGG